MLLNIDKSELKTLAKLSLPISLHVLIGAGISIVNTITLGHTSSSALAASSLAGLVINTSLCIAYGMASPLDTLISQAFGAKNFEAIGHAMQRSVVLVFACALPLAFLWLNTENILLAMGQDPEICKMAGEFMHIFMYARWPILFSIVLTRYLSLQKILIPGVVANVLGLICNICLNVALVHGVNDWPGLGWQGSPYADAISRYVMTLFLVGYIFWSKVYRQSWPAFLSFAAFTWKGFRSFLSLGIPGTISLVFEVVGMESLSLVAGSLGAHAIAVSSVVGTLFAMNHLMAIGIGAAASMRVGTLIGEGKDTQAKTSTIHSICLAAGTMLFFGLLMLFSRSHLASAISNDPSIIETAMELVPWAILVLVVDGVQITCMAILKGTGRHKLAAVSSFFGLYLVGLPSSVLLCNVFGKGVSGMWAGFFLGLSVMAFFSLFFVLRINWKHECEKSILEHCSDTSMSSLEDGKQQARDSGIELDVLESQEFDHDGTLSHRRSSVMLLGSQKNENENASLVENVQ